MGLSLNDFLDLTPDELALSINAHHEGINWMMRHIMIMIRWSTCELININLERGKRLKPDDILEFSWEKGNKPAPPSPEELKQAFANFDKQRALRKNGV